MVVHRRGFQAKQKTLLALQQPPPPSLTLTSPLSGCLGVVSAQSRKSDFKSAIYRSMMKTPNVNILKKISRMLLNIKYHWLFLCGNLGKKERQRVPLYWIRPLLINMHSLFIKSENEKERKYQ